MDSGSTDGGLLVEQLSPHEGREAALFDAASIPLAGEAGLTIASTCSLIWNGMEKEMLDDSGRPVGRSHAGTVERVHSCLRSWTIGERISGIGYGSEASSRTIFTPANLAVKLPLNVSFEEAVFAAPGAAAVRAVRLAGIKKGATVAVIGLGLPGRLTCRLLTMTGCCVLGLDDQETGSDADHMSGIYRVFPIEENSVQAILDITSGQGADAVILTEFPNRSVIMEIAGLICKNNAKVVAIGIENQDCASDIYMEKNLTLVSTSFPGSEQDELERDTFPEDRGQARMLSISRNGMQTFLDFISAGRIEVNSLISHRFHIDRFDEACEMISDHKRRECLGVLLSSDLGGKELKPRLTLPKWRSIKPVRSRGVTMGLIGTNHVEQMMESGFEIVQSLPEELMSDPAVDSVYISNDHNQHSEWVIKSLLSGKATFVDKCLGMNEDEIEQIEAAYLATGAPLLVGYSRRFAPLTAKIREILKERNYPVSMHYRINPRSSALISRDGDHQDNRRPVMEEICDSLDLLSFLVGGRPVRIHAEALSMPDDRYRCDDNLQMMVRYSEGSVGTINYAASGDSKMTSEYLEILGNGMMIRLDDFRSLAIMSDGKLDRSENVVKDTGIMRMIGLWHYYLTTGLGSPIPFEDLKHSSLAAFRIMESLEDGSPANMAG